MRFDQVFMKLVCWVFAASFYAAWSSCLLSNCLMSSFSGFALWPCPHERYAAWPSLLRAALLKLPIPVCNVARCPLYQVMLFHLDFMMLGCLIFSAFVLSCWTFPTSFQCAWFSLGHAKVSDPASRCYIVWPFFNLITQCYAASQPSIPPVAWSF